ncbi:MAG: hypothetical protein Q9195_005349 [Heterodermia aff. obscurata]
MARRPGFRRSPAPSPEPGPARRRSQRSRAPSPEPTPAAVRPERSEAPSPDSNPDDPIPRSSRSRNNVRFAPDTRTSPSGSPRPSGTRARRGPNPPARSVSSDPAGFQAVVPSRRPDRASSASSRSPTRTIRSRSTRFRRPDPSIADNNQQPDPADEPYSSIETDASQSATPSPPPPYIHPPPYTSTPARSGRQTRSGSARSSAPMAAGSITPPDGTQSPDDFIRDQTNTSADSAPAAEQFTADLAASASHLPTATTLRSPVPADMTATATGAACCAPTPP